MYYLHWKYYCTSFYASNKYAGLLMLPYVIWLSYASYLNGGNLILNEDQPGYTRD